MTGAAVYIGTTDLIVRSRLAPGGTSEALAICRRRSGIIAVDVFVRDASVPGLTGPRIGARRERRGPARLARAIGRRRSLARDVVARKTVLLRLTSILSRCRRKGSCGTRGACSILNPGRVSRLVSPGRARWAPREAVSIVVFGRSVSRRTMRTFVRKRVYDSVMSCVATVTLRPEPAVRGTRTVREHGHRKKQKSREKGETRRFHGLSVSCVMTTTSVLLLLLLTMIGHVDETERSFQKLF